VVYGSLQHLNDADVQAMAGYLQTLPPPAPAAPAPAPDPSEMARAMEAGGKLYAKHCADCHGANGEGQATAYPPLAGNRSLALPSAVNPIRLVLNGGFPPGTAGNPRPYGMPPFRVSLSNEEVAAVLTYARNSWGNQGGPVSSVEVGRYAAIPVE